MTISRGHHTQWLQMMQISIYLVVILFGPGHMQKVSYEKTITAREKVNLPSTSAKNNSKKKIKLGLTVDAIQFRQITKGHNDLLF